MYLLVFKISKKNYASTKEIVSVINTPKNMSVVINMIDSVSSDLKFR